LSSSLNDAAALLIQIEPGDDAEIARLAESLEALAADPSLPEIARDQVRKAAEDVGRDLVGASDGPAAEAVLTGIGDRIEAAMHALEEAGKVEPGMTDTPGPEADEPDAVSAGEDLRGFKNFGDLGGLPEHKAEPEPAPEASAPDLSPQSSNGADRPVASTDTAAGSEPLTLPAAADPELVGAFITESADLIANAEETLLALEVNPDDTDAISTVFRAFHTIKGTSAFLELSLISDLAHRAESILSQVRDGEIRYEGGYPDLALRAVDMLKALISAVQGALDGTPYFRPDGYDELHWALSHPEAAGKLDAAAEPSPPPVETSPSTEGIGTDGASGPSEAFELFGDAVPDRLVDAEPTPEPPVPEPESVSPSPAEEPVSGSPRSRPGGRLETSARGVVDASVRVPIDRLDRFIDMVGELVVAHSMVTQDQVVVDGGHHDLQKKVAQTGKIVRELQNMSMSMRMIPLKATFQKMARLVRDLSRKAGKTVAFETEGDDTEIDRNMVDIINDPLVHMVRNAVDHGLESPDDRESVGKPRTGGVWLSAYHAAGNVVVEIADDGRGLDRDAILERAVERDMISPGEHLSDREIFNLIFEPGFSTARTVSEVSGRGVGMDVVKTNIESIRGQVEVQSRPGEGSVFRMSLPLTLAIIDGMVVRVSTQKYVIPTVSIVRSVQPEAAELVNVLRRGEMLRLQGRLIPLFRLAELFEVDGAEADPTRAIVVVVEDDGRQVGLLVDELIGSQQIVIKTMGDALGDISGISGSAIMPDGRVGLILDVGGLVRIAGTGA
jgi:two-component system, chemotaxis family, sensor kinase CheA